MEKTKLLTILVVICFVAISLFALSACSEEPAQTGADNNIESAQSAAQSTAQGASSPVRHEHDFQFHSFVWTKYTAKARYVCEKDNVAALYDAVVTSEVTKQPSCLETGTKTYTATYDGHTDVKTETLDKTDHHNYVDGICTVCGKKSMTKGLDYAFSAEDMSYTVTGLGTVTDTDLIIPATIDGLPVKKIADYAFVNCPELTSVTFVNSSPLTAIGEAAFNGCKNLMSVTIPESVNSIGDYAFSGCHKLVEVFNKSTLPITVGDKDHGYVGYYAKNIYTPTNGASKLSVDKDGYVVYNDGASKTLIGATTVKTTLDLPDYITAINDYAFFNYPEPISITIPASVKSIGVNAFYGCYKLTEIYNKSTLRITVGDFNNGYVGFYAKNIYTPTNGASKLTFDNDGYIIYTDGADKILVGFAGSGTALTLPSGITEICDYAFYNQSGLTSVTIGGAVTKIGDYAFAFCGSLTSVIIPESVTEIGDCAFRACGELVSVTIPYGVTSVGYCAFYDCGNLKSVTIPTSVTIIGDNSFYNCSSLTSVTIPDNVTSIGNYAFWNCLSLTDVIIGNGVTSIGNYAFAYCGGLTNKYYKGDAENWKKISVGSNNDPFKNARLYLYSETEPALNGNGSAYVGLFWHYDEDGNIVVWVKQ